MSLDNLKRIDNRPVFDNRDEIRAFLVVGNDMLRLDSVLKHHRQLGVGRFFIVDRGSSDGTLDYLAAAPDVHAFSASSDVGVAEINALLDKYGNGHWTLTIDADEMFIYPHYEQLELPLFCRYLDHVKAQAIACVSLDMYAASPVRDAVHRPGTPLLNTCGYFDAAPYDMVRSADCPYFEIHGGLRRRAFGEKPVEQSPVLSRMPLVRWKAGMRYLRGTGNITPVALGGIMAALLRFEFLSDFADRPEDGIALSEGPSTNLYSDGSVRFQNSTQLVELGLMKTAKAYEESVQLTSAARSARSA